MKGVQNKLEDFFDETCQSMQEILQLPVFKVKGGSPHTCWIYIFFIMPLRRCKNIFFSTLEDSQCYEVTFVFLLH